MMVLRVLTIGLVLSVLIAASAEASTTIATGGAHSCAITVHGVVECWGENGSGQLGDGTTTDRAARAPVAGLGGMAVQVVAGERHTCAVLTTGVLRCWGHNSYSQLGDGAIASQPSPITVDTGGAVESAAAGGEHTCAVLTGGELKCWGRNNDGQIGTGGLSNRVGTPTTVGSLGATALQVSAGYWHTCARLSDNSLKCWGDNVAGQIGDGTQTDAPSPVLVSGMITSVASVSAGDFHTCAIVAGATICWGENANGQVGDGTFAVKLVPTTVTGLATGATAVQAGGRHTCALLATGGLSCWGRNVYGEIGDGTKADRNTPTAVTSISLGASSVEPGGMHTCAVLATREARCWGSNGAGQLGSGDEPRRLVPGDEVQLTQSAVGVVSGFEHTCVREVGGILQCFGLNDHGQLGDGTTRDSDTPVGVTGAAAMISLAAGNFHTCTSTSALGIQCWGYNIFGQLGDGTSNDSSTPVNAQGFSSNAVAVAPGWYHTCALVTGAGVKCWGYNNSGQVGDSTIQQRPSAVDVTGLTSGVAEVASGALHSCARLSGGGVKCWGANNGGQLGDGSSAAYSSSPVDVTGVTGATKISAGGATTCAIVASGAVKCWGGGNFGQLGNGVSANSNVPVDVTGLTGALSIDVGGLHVCARTGSSTAKCWGSNDEGQLGDGTRSDRNTPVDVSGLTGVTELAAGLHHTCALVAPNDVRCWGSNATGQLGDGLAFRESPVAVSGPADLLLPGESPTPAPEPPAGPPAATPAVASRLAVARHSRARRSGSRLSMRVRNTFALPAGTDLAAACSGRVTISTRPTGSRRTVSTRTPLRAYRTGCRAIGTLKLTRRSLGRKLRITARFAGSATLAAYRVTRSVRVR